MNPKDILRLKAIPKILKEFHWSNEGHLECQLSLIKLSRSSMNTQTDTTYGFHRLAILLVQGVLKQYTKTFL